MPGNPATLKALVSERMGEPTCRTQFIVAMTAYIMLAGRMKSADAMPIASEAYRTFERDNRTCFGDPAFDWNLSAACTVAEEYEVAHWPAEVAHASR